MLIHSINLFVVTCLVCVGSLLTSQENLHAQDTQKSLWTRTVGDDWPAFLGPTGDGKSAETGIIKDWSNGKLKVVWEVETGGGYGIGSVAKGRFYHFGRFENDAVLICLNAETGKLLWNFSYPSEYRDMYGYDRGPRASPIVDDGLVYIFGVEGMLHCLDAITGKEIWKLNTAEKFGVIQNFFGVASTPIVFEDTLFVMVGGSPDESKEIPRGKLNLVKPDGTGLLALNKKSGELKFKCIDDLASYSSLKIADLNGSPTLLAWMRDSLYGINPTDGKVDFEFPWRSRILESVNASAPVVHNQQILITECYGKGSALIKPVKGDTEPELIWSDDELRDKSMAAHWNTPIVVGDAFYGCTGRNTSQAEIRAVDWKTGKVHWSEPGLSRTSMTYVDGHFIVIGEQAQVLLIKASTDKFEEVTRYVRGEGDNVRFGLPMWAAPIVSHGFLYVRGKDKLVCFDLIPVK